MTLKSPFWRWNLGVGPSSPLKGFWIKVFMAMNLPHGYLFTHGTKTGLPDLAISRHSKKKPQMNT